MLIFVSLWQCQLLFHHRNFMLQAINIVIQICNFIDFLFMWLIIDQMDTEKILLLFYIHRVQLKASNQPTILRSIAKCQPQYWAQLNSNSKDIVYFSFQLSPQMQWLVHGCKAIGNRYVIAWLIDSLSFFMDGVEVANYYKAYLSTYSSTINDAWWCDVKNPVHFKWIILAKLSGSSS